MRKLFILAALAVGLTSYAGAKIEWDRQRYDFGAFNESTNTVTAEFVYRNTGDEPLVITGARANCGCTTPRYTADVLQPGDSAILSVTYDAGGRPGRFEKKIYVDTNTEPKRSTLTIRGVVVGNPSTVSGRYPVAVGDLRLAHSAALLGSINRGEVKAVFESGYNASVDTLRPVVTEVPEWLQVKPVPEQVPPGEQVSFSFYVMSSKVPGWDLVTDTVVIRENPGSDIALRMPVIVTVKEDFSQLSDKQRINSPIVRFDRERLEPVVLNDDNTTAYFTIFNDGKDPLKIRRVYTLTPGVKVDVKPDQTVKSGKSQTVGVAIPRDCLKGSEASAVILNVITNDPVTPKRSVTIPVAANL